MQVRIPIFDHVNRVRRTVKNWYEVFLVTRGIMNKARIEFIDGTTVMFRKENHTQLMAYCEYLDIPQKIKDSLKMTARGDTVYLHYKNKVILVRRSTAASLANELYYGSHVKLDVKNRIVLDIGTYVGDTPVYYVVAGGAKKVRIRDF